VVATLETIGFWIHTLLSGRQISRTQQPIAYATVFVARTGSFASSVEAQLVAEIRADNALDQGSPIDDLVCLLHQDDEEIHGARAERYDLCAICQKPVSDRLFERAEAQDFAALIAHGILSSMPVLEVTS
jgi:hypothetical protein